MAGDEQAQTSPSGGRRPRRVTGELGSDKPHTNGQRAAQRTRSAAPGRAVSGANAADRGSLDDDREVLDSAAESMIAEDAEHFDAAYWREQRPPHWQ